MPVQRAASHSTAPTASPPDHRPPPGPCRSSRRRPAPPPYRAPPAPEHRPTRGPCRSRLSRPPPTPPYRPPPTAPPRRPHRTPYARRPPQPPAAPAVPGVQRAAADRSGPREPGGGTTVPAAPVQRVPVVRPAPPPCGHTRGRTGEAPAGDRPAGAAAHGPPGGRVRARPAVTVPVVRRKSAAPGGGAAAPVQRTGAGDVVTSGVTLAHPRACPPRRHPRVARRGRPGTPSRRRNPAWTWTTWRAACSTRWPGCSAPNCGAAGTARAAPTTGAAEPRNGWATERMRSWNG